MNISKDISNRLDPSIVEVLCDLTDVTTSLGISFFVVGATARDIIFSALYGIPTTRVSMDIDLGVCINTWEDFERIVDKLISKKSYRRDKTQIQRLHQGETLVDIVPFGTIEHPAGSITWPPNYDIVMKTVGFQEALLHAEEVKISTEPDILVKVSTPPALAVMKLIAWKDVYPRRTKDALDFHFLLKTYIRAGNNMRLFDSDDDLLSEQLAPDQESARLLGRDAQILYSEETRMVVSGILNEELSENSSLRLVGDMISTGLGDDRAADLAFQLLRQFQTGFTEVLKRKESDSQ